VSAQPFKRGFPLLLGHFPLLIAPGKRTDTISRFKFSLKIATSVFSRRSFPIPWRIQRSPGRCFPAWRPSADSRSPSVWSMFLNVSTRLLTSTLFPVQDRHRVFSSPPIKPTKPPPHRSFYLSHRFSRRQPFLLKGKCFPQMTQEISSVVVWLDLCHTLVARNFKPAAHFTAT